MYTAHFSPVRGRAVYWWTGGANHDPMYICQRFIFWRYGRRCHQQRDRIFLHEISSSYIAALPA